MKLNRQRLVIALLALLMVAAVASIFVVSETRRTMARVVAVDMQETMDRLVLMADYYSVVNEAESSLRRYLLTGDRRHRALFEAEAARAPRILDALATEYDATSPSDARAVRDLATKSGRRLEGMTTLAALYEREGGRAALDLLATGTDDTADRELRLAIQQLRSAERERIRTLGKQWNAMHARGVQVTLATAALVATLIVGLALALALRAQVVVRHRATLEAQVRERTRELAQLAAELQSLTERERANIARELHDELGGILVAVKMDLTQLKQRLEGRDVDLVARIDRMESALMSGITLKRRILEQLHPSLLDNVGLMAAVRWQAEESCDAAGLDCELTLPEIDPPLTKDQQISVFRIAQEAVSNVIKHAGAAMMRVHVEVQQDELAILVEDDGTGIKGQPEKLGKSHGLAGMRHRVRALGGTLSIQPRQPNGTRVLVTVPLGAQDLDATAA